MKQAALTSFILISLIFTGCEEKIHPLNLFKEKAPAISSTHLVRANHETFNAYVAILQNHCDEAGTAAYTFENTFFYPLSVANDFDCFICMTEVPCQYPSGSCGYAIEVYKKKGDAHEVLFQTCGFNVAVLPESYDGIQGFTYRSKLGLVTQVNYSQNTFREEPISMNGLNYSCLTQISEITQTNAADFVPDDPENGDNISYRIKIKRFQLNRNYYGALYETEISGNHHVFLFADTSLLFYGNNLHKLEPLAIPESDFAPLQVSGDTDYTLTPDSSVYRIRNYIYSKKTRRYEEHVSNLP